MLRVPRLLRRLPWLLPLLAGCPDDGGSDSGTDASTGDAPTSTTTTSTSTSTSTSSETTDTTNPTGESTTGNLGPTAEDDTFFAVQNEALVLDAMDGVTTNDSDPDGDPLTVTAFDALSTGGAAVEVDADGGLTYTPAPGFWGPDTFAYTIEDDGGEAASATATVFVAPRLVPLGEVTLGVGGFVIDGAAADDAAGISVSDAGDVNGDGMGDLVVGAPGASPNGNRTGQAYVVFGKADTDPVELGALGTGGFALNGEVAGDTAGFSVSGAGDVNDDGVDDIIIGAKGAAPNGASSGRTYVVFGKSDSDTVELGELGTGGFVLNGEAVNDFSGWSVSGAGDVNGDGMNDIVVGAYRADASGNASGRSYVIFGKADDTTIELSALDTGGFLLNGAAATDYSGRSVSGAGDVNGDGMADVIVGSYLADPNGSSSGQSYVVFGKGDTAAVDLGALGSSGFRLDGEVADDRSGGSVSGAGDVNGDGIADLVIGAPRADPNGASSGRAYVVFGKADTTAVALGDLGTGGFVLNGEAAGDAAGTAVSGAGDVNGDGLDDIIVGAYGSNANGDLSGRIYVVFGKTDTTLVELSELGAGGFVLDGESGGDYAGWSVHAAGDVNGDGLADIILGAYLSDPNGNDSGRSYVVFGVRTQ